MPFPNTKPVGLKIPTVRSAQRVVAFSPSIERLMAKVWQCPLLKLGDQPRGSFHDALAPTRILTYVCWLLPLIFIGLSGCNFVPDVRHKPQYHNPFPQIRTVAVLPFRNQSQDATLAGSRVTLAYYNELQSIPGFEVLPVGVVEAQLRGFEEQVLGRPLSRPEDFQQFANFMHVDAVLQGSITDFESYYPPRMTLKVNWYAANPGFHPIPPGYGLPWGTKAEKKIDESIRLEAERALAREQLKTQSPIVDSEFASQRTAESPSNKILKAIQVADEDAATLEDAHVMQATALEELQIPTPEQIAGEPIPPLMEPEPKLAQEAGEATSPSAMNPLPSQPQLPAEWPDPQGFIPPAPKSTRPLAQAQSEPIISHMKAYNGSDEDFTHKLSDYYYHRDDARFGGWEAYLQRSEDFIRFCSHLHIVETLAARGGQLESRTVVRWPIDRYQR